MARVLTLDDLSSPAVRDSFPIPAVRGLAVPRASPEVPEIVCPFPQVGIHPQAERLKKDNFQWIVEKGMAPPYPGVSEEEVLGRLQRQCMPDLHARMWCDAPKYDYLALADKLLTFFWILDDFMDEPRGDEYRAQQVEYVQAFRPILWAGVPGPCRDPWGARTLNTFAELWAQVRAISPLDQLKRHASVIDNWLNVSLDESGAVRHERRIPTTAHILGKFIQVHGMDMFIPWNEIALNAFLPEEIYGHPSVADTHVRFMNAVCWYNDIFGFNRDMASGEVYNLIAAMMAHEGKSSVEAVTFLVDRINADMTALDYMAQSAGKDGIADDRLERYTAGIKKVVRAMLEWHVTSGKYDWHEVFTPAAPAPASASPSRPGPGRVPAGPTGMGTSASRLTAHLAAR
ncbi:terpene synthase family protein [Streptomyces sp. H39-S7]|uniref:terpene synthase family protein n=1 Tax=Streptomyces sp. H39-S7 TaxID=3004357 RepID=UPI0022AE77B9|nr:terpene synthase family protein [Streptomyces sp. H39-S7]MCZ4124159.1 terpene synthase family protein [Streptomyces sp. H39-S7]